MELQHCLHLPLPHWLRLGLLIHKFLMLSSHVVQFLPLSLVDMHSYLRSQSTGHEVLTQFRHGVRTFVCPRSIPISPLWRRIGTTLWYTVNKLSNCLKTNLLGQTIQVFCYESIASLSFWIYSGMGSSNHHSWKNTIQLIFVQIPLGRKQDLATSCFHNRIIEFAVHLYVTFTVIEDYFWYHTQNWVAVHDKPTWKHRFYSYNVMLTPMSGNKQKVRCSVCAMSMGYGTILSNTETG